MNLAPGVQCEIVPSKCAPDSLNEFIGMRCVALGPDPLTGLISLLFGGNGHEHWLAELENGQTISLCHMCLRPIDPPHADDGTWARIRDITGWTPAKEPA